MSANKRPVSRIDSKDTHGYFARVYRSQWSKGRMFSDAVWGGAEKAERAALTWQRKVDALLPVIPPKPILKVAKFKLRKNGSGRYYDAYLPMPGKGKPKQTKLYFSDINDMEKQAGIAYDLVTKQNAMLVSAHRLSMAAWKKECEKTLAYIDAIWSKVSEVSYQKLFVKLKDAA